MKHGGNGIEKLYITTQDKRDIENTLRKSDVHIIGVSEDKDRENGELIFREKME